MTPPTFAPVQGTRAQFAQIERPIDFAVQAAIGADDAVDPAARDRLLRGLAAQLAQLEHLQVPVGYLTPAGALVIIAQEKYAPACITLGADRAGRVLGVVRFGPKTPEAT